MPQLRVPLGPRVRPAKYLGGMDEVERLSWLGISITLWALVFLVLLAFISCGGDPRSRYPVRPTFTVSGWDCYLAASLTPAERALVREAVEDHLRAWAPLSRGRHPSWRVRRPRVFVTAARVLWLRGPASANTQGTADHREQSLEVVCGRKFTLPALMREAHQLRHGPDPYGQLPALGWATLHATAARVVASLEARR